MTKLGKTHPVRSCRVSSWFLGGWPCGRCASVGGRARTGRSVRHVRGLRSVDGDCASFPWRHGRGMTGPSLLNRRSGGPQANPRTRGRRTLRRFALHRAGMEDGGVTGTVECAKCKRSVFPTSDGDCPGCGLELLAMHAQHDEPTPCPPVGISVAPVGGAGHGRYGESGVVHTQRTKLDEESEAQPLPDHREGHSKRRECQCYWNLSSLVCVRSIAGSCA